MISIKDFIDIIEPEFDEIPKGTLTSLHQFKNIEGWSSMLSLIIVSKINKIFKVHIHSQELANANTIEDLYKVVINKLQSQ